MAAVGPFFRGFSACFVMSPACAVGSAITTTIAAAWSSRHRRERAMTAASRSRLQAQPRSFPQAARRPSDASGMKPWATAPPSTGSASRNSAALS
jgi:hypothetical protein